MTTKRQWETHYKIRQIIPAPTGLVAVYIDHKTLHPTEARSAERDVVAFAMYDAITGWYCDEKLEHGTETIRREAGALIADDFGNFVPVITINYQRLELNGLLYGQRFHLNSRHQEQRLLEDVACFADNVVPNDDSAWPDHGIIAPENAGPNYVSRREETLEMLEFKVNESIKKAKKGQVIWVNLGYFGDYISKYFQEIIRRCEASNWAAIIDNVDGYAALQLTPKEKVLVQKTVNSNSDGRV
jgi:hypothetical protein